MMKRILVTTVAAMLFAANAPAQDQIQAGVSAAVRGDVQIARADAVGRQVNSGEPIFLEDAIVSGSDSGMQVLLLDETVFTIGPESEISIDQFVYDPNIGEGSLVASMAKGTMRFVTGNIAAGTPENMSIKLPVGTIGIRGTNGVVTVLTQQQAQQQFPDQSNQLGGGGGPEAPVIFAALNGPGPLSNAGAGTGSFNFSTPNGDVDLNRPGAAVLATPGQPPVFFIAPPGSIQSVTSGLRSNGNGNDDDGAGTDDADDGTPQAQDDGAAGDDGAADDESAGGDNSGTDDGDTQTASNDQGDSETQGGGSTGTNTISESGVSNDVSFNQATTNNAVANTSGNAAETVSDVQSSGTTGFSFADLGGLSGSASFPTGTIGGPADVSITTFSIGFSSRDVNFDANIDGGSGRIHTGPVGAQGAVSWDGLSGSAIITLGANGNVSSGTDCSCTASLRFNSGTNVDVTVTNGSGASTEATLTGSSGS